jgi:putative DNA primase/helicase
MGNNLAFKEKDIDVRSKLLNKIKNSKNLIFDPRDLANKVLVSLYKDENVRYLYILKKKRFMRYKDGVWTEENVDEGSYLRNFVTEFLNDISPAYNRIGKVNDVIRNIITLTSKLKNNNLFDPANQIKRLINFKNLMFDVKNEKKIKHTPKVRSIYQLPVNFSDEAECPLWEKSLKQWIDDEETIKFLQEYTGYILSTYTSGHKFVIFLGKGANGKSVFLNIIKALLGDSYHSMGLARLVNNNRFVAHSLEGKLANLCSDIDPVQINSSELIKRIAGGDPVDAEIKCGGTYTYDPVMKLLFSANKMPILKNVDYGFYRRLEIIKFPNRFSPGMKNYDPQLTEKLKEELEGIALWAIQGLIRFLKQGEQFTISDSMTREKFKYMDKSNIFKSFTDEFVKETNNKEDYIPTEKLYQQYKIWIKQKDLASESKNMLTRYINENEIGLNKKDDNEKGAGIKTINGKSTRCYIGLKLKNTDEKEVISNTFAGENSSGNYEFEFMK